jgi:hypothetical protein
MYVCICVYTGGYIYISSTAEVRLLDEKKEGFQDFRYIFLN